MTLLHINKDYSEVMANLMQEMESIGFHCKYREKIGSLFVYLYPDYSAICEFYIKDGMILDFEGEYDEYEVAKLSDPKCFAKVITYAKNVFDSRLAYLKHLVKKATKHAPKC